MKKLALVLLVFCFCAAAQVYQPINGWCQLGGVGVAAPQTLGGVPIQQFMQASYTSCTITVYNHGTVVPATLYSTSSGTALANPFQANVLGFYQAFAATGLYDVQESGSVSPTVSLGTVSLFDLTTFSFAGGSNTQVQYNCSGALCGSAGLVYNPVTQALTIGGSLSAGSTSITGTLSATGNATLAGTSVTSLSDSGSASIAALATLLGGAYINVPGSQATGGYIDFAPITYPPTVGQTCYDAYGNKVSQPSPTGGGSFGANDVILWNSESPLQGYHAPWTIVGGANYYITGVPCASPIPVPAGVPNGINLNAYVFANYGFASGNPAFDTVQIFGGGIQGGSITAAHLYPPGTQLASGYTPITGVTVDGSGRLSNPYGAYLGGYVMTGYSDQNPGGSSGSCDSIAVCDNPLNGGPNPIVPGINASVPTTGTITYNTTLNCEVVYNGVAWVCMGGGGGSATGPLYAIQSNNPSGSLYGDAHFTYSPGTPDYVTLGSFSSSGVIQVLGTSGGFNAPNGAAFNTIQAPSGGSYALVHTSLNYMFPGSYTTTLASGPPVAPNASFTAGDISYYAGGSPCIVWYNGSTWACLTGASTNYWTLTSGSIYNSTGSHVLVGETSIVDALAKFEVNGGSNFLGAVQSQVTPCTPSPTCSSPVAFQTTDGSGHNYFIVDANGDVTASGQLNVDATVSANGTGISAAVFNNNTASHATVSATNLGGGYGFADALSFAGDYFFKVTAGSCVGCGQSVQSVVTGSRVLGTVYQNTNSYGIFVVSTIASSSTNAAILAKCDGSSSPTTLVAVASAPSSAESMTLSFPVPPGYYYVVATTGSGAGVTAWVEYH